MIYCTEGVVNSDNDPNDVDVEVVNLTQTLPPPPATHNYDLRYTGINAAKHTI
jgi:hypothetical protein